MAPQGEQGMAGQNMRRFSGWEYNHVVRSTKESVFLEN